MAKSSCTVCWVVTDCSNSICTAKCDWTHFVYLWGSSSVGHGQNCVKYFAQNSCEKQTLILHYVKIINYIWSSFFNGTNALNNFDNQNVISDQVPPLINIDSPLKKHGVTCVILCIWGCGWNPSPLVTLTHTLYIQPLYMHILTNCPLEYILLHIIKIELRQL